MHMRHPEVEKRPVSRPYALPSFTSLSCFEAAARNNSFKAAAAELNVTPAAVSHQIKALEAEMAQPLFRRQHRGVELTEAGAFLFVAVQRGFEGISGAVREIRGRPEGEDVIIHATTAVSAFWLTPQISHFWSHHPETVVSQVVSDVEPMEDRVDLSIRYGPIPDDDGTYVTLFTDNIVAVGSKEFARRYAVASVADLAAAPLVHVTTRRVEWTGWKDWLGAFGVEAQTGKRTTVNNFMIALQLAQDGVGAVLGWERLIGTLLEQEALVPLVPDHLVSPHPFYLQIHPRASAEARFVAEWIARQAG
ncbi:DNA-binding transcriptional regulator, LysR family [Palleronia salina]|uniref:DNA-binding transcriptional regulator, LysR family n=1 Tax=Palleronia salina TaxID=313368 RepID=A0A1M6H4C3_9RHOB|nr:DNA-binding transcriptional regulator, LysR family [Palleronia salina]